MDSIVGSFSEIEKTANSIVESAESRKHELEQKMQEKREEFDAELEAKTQAKVIKIRVEIQKRMDKLLAEQEEENQAAIEGIKTDFSRHHRDYVKEIVGRITEA